MRYKVIFKSQGQIFDEDPSGIFPLSIDPIESSRRLFILDPGWRDRVYSNPIVIEGSTFEEALRRATEIEGIEKWYLSYFEMLPEGEQFIWDQYYCSALQGILSSRQNSLPIYDDELESSEEKARESANRSIVARRKMTGDA